MIYLSSIYGTREGYGVISLEQAKSSLDTVQIQISPLCLDSHTIPPSPPRLRLLRTIPRLFSVRIARSSEVSARSDMQCHLSRRWR